MLHRLRDASLLAFTLTLLAAGAAPAPAQDHGPAAVASATAPQDTLAVRRASKRLFTRRDAVAAGAFVLGTVAMFPLDRRIAEELQNPNTQANEFLNDAATGVEWVATPGSFWIGTTLYAAGRLAGKPRLADLGLHGLEAIAMTSVMTSLIKNVAGRARPFVSKDTAPHDFEFLRGRREGSDYRSFPSGHSSSAFAAASAVTAEAVRWKPALAPYVGVAMYGGAAMVALSRMYHDRHWGSDVVLGAALGTFSGWKVVQFNHDNPRNRFNRLLLPSAVVPRGGGATVAWVIPTP